MRLKNNLFLARANLNGSRRKNTVMVMMVLSVVAVIALIGFLNIVNTKMETNKQKEIVRQIYVMPQNSYKNSTSRGVTPKNINEILNIEHVVSCEKTPYASMQTIKIDKIEDENGTDISNETEQLNLDALSEGLQMQYVDSNFTSQIIDGESLDNAPVMSCIVPHYYLYELNDKEQSTNELLGKTISVSCSYLIHLYNKSDTKGYDGQWEYIANINYKLKVVGVYYFSRETSPDGGISVLISPETAKKLENTALEECQKKGNLDVSDYINDQCARDYIVTVDNYDNVQEVGDKLLGLGFNVGARAGYLDDSAVAFSAIFGGAGTFLVVAIMLLTTINIFLSVHNNISDRKAEIGLMKALGYKTHQIFYCMYLENVILAVKSLIIGSAISAVIVGAINIINSNSSTIQRVFVMPWSDFLILAVVALAVILIIPLICQLIMVNLVAKIQPQEAMNS